MTKLKPIEGAVNIPFSRHRYDKSDAPAKDCIVNYLRLCGHEIVDTDEDFSVDIKSEVGYTKFYSEAEIKYGWKGDWNPSWKEIRIPYRKHKLINAVGDKGVLHFYVIRPDLQQAWRIDGETLAKSEVREAKGRQILKGEMFFHVPYEEAELVRL